MARGRSAPGGIYKRLCTSTFKDSSEWRTFRDVASKAPDWRVAKLLGLDSPFVWPKHWERFRANGITAREYQRRVLAMDVGFEVQLYHTFRRTDDQGAPANVSPIPLRAEDVTAEVLAPYGRNMRVLIGHDPGQRQHVSEFLKAYRYPGDKTIRWFVVDEITTPDATVEAHVAQVLKRLREQWSCNQLDWKGRVDTESAQALVRIDPHTRSGDAHPGQDVYTRWRAAGLIAKAAAYKPGSVDPAVIKRESRFDLVNVLLCDIQGRRRLIIACDDHGRPAAPKLLGAFESMERDEKGRGEHEDKNESDQSHWPAAVGYALWQIEHPRLATRVA